MAGKRDKPEELSPRKPLVRESGRRVKLREVEVLQGQGLSVADAVRQIGMTVQTGDRWRRLSGDMGREQVKRLKEFETSQSDGRDASPKTGRLWLNDGTSPPA